MVELPGVRILTVFQQFTSLPTAIKKIHKNTKIHLSVHAEIAARILTVATRFKAANEAHVICIKRSTKIQVHAILIHHVVDHNLILTKKIREVGMTSPEVRAILQL